MYNDFSKCSYVLVTTESSKDVEEKYDHRSDDENLRDIEVFPIIEQDSNKPITMREDSNEPIAIESESSGWLVYINQTYIR